MIVTESTLESFVQRARGLYSLPAVALRVLELTGQPQVDLRALKECIENDPAITAKVLRVVNSSLYGLSREVTDLGQALALLGIKPLKLLVLGFSLSEAVFSRFTGRAMLRYWRHTLTKAVAAREIAETICRIPGDEAFIAALLQDIGLLVLLQSLGEPYARLANRPFASQEELAEWEIESLGFEHTELTARLLAHWGLPVSLQRAVALRRAEHDRADDDASDPESLPRILRLAHQLADLVAEERHELLAHLLHADAPHGRLTQAQLSVLVGNLQTNVAQLAEVFSLELPPGMDYRDVLVQAQARMAEISAELAGELLPSGPRRETAKATGVSATTAPADDIRALTDALGRLTVVYESKRAPAARAAEPQPTLPCANQAIGVAPTGDESSAGILQSLTATIQTCRQAQWPLSFALVEIDHFAAWVLDHGPHDAARASHLVHELCQQLDAAEVHCLAMRPYLFAISLLDCDRTQAAKLCHHLVHEVRHLSGASLSSAGGVTVSMGLASAEVLPKSFSASTLYSSAARCLWGAKAAGGNALKSIGIY